MQFNICAIEPPFYLPLHFLSSISISTSISNCHPSMDALLLAHYFSVNLFFPLLCFSKSVGYQKLKLRLDGRDRQKKKRSQIKTNKLPLAGVRSQTTNEFQFEYEFTWGGGINNGLQLKVFPLFLFNIEKVEQ